MDDTATRPRTNDPARDALAPPPLLDLARDALFCDLDGTLARIEPHPDAVGPEPGRTALLEGLCAAMDDRVAVVSGRSLEDLDRVLATRRPALAGVHGLARRDSGGRVTASRPHPSLAHARRRLSAFVHAHPGVYVEDKHLAIAVHYRGAPKTAEAVKTLTARLAHRYGLALQNGRMVAELRTPGPDKGAAIASFMDEAPFAGARPVFIGDDLTDEHGFEAAARMGGYGVLVGAPRVTAALYSLADVDAAQAWLRRSLEAAR